jgi:hypothetical protein
VKIINSISDILENAIMKPLISMMIRRAFIAAIIVLFGGTLGSIIMFTYSLAFNPTFDLSKVSNIGFLMLIALSNVCFSWARSVDPKYINTISRINSVAARALIAAMLFIFASLFSFILQNYEAVAFNPSSVGAAEIEVFILKVCNTVSIIGAMIMATWVLLGVVGNFLGTSTVTPSSD